MVISGWGLNDLGLRRPQHARFQCISLRIHLHDRLLLKL